MKKSLLLFFIWALAMPGAAFAQQESVAVGIKAGAAFTTFSGPDAKAFASQFGVLGGVFATLPLSKWISLQPELLYAQKGAGFASVGSGYRLHYLDVPLAVRGNYRSFYVEAGPQVGYLLGARAYSGFDSDEASGLFNSFDVGYLLGVGYQAPHNFGIGWRFTNGLTDCAAPVMTSTGSRQPQFHNQGFQFFISYALK